MNLTMNLADTIYRKSLDLPADKARAVIDFIDFIKSRLAPVETPPENRPAVQPSALYRAFAQAGLIGCLETDEQLATTYKQKLDFSSKHGKSA